MGRPSGGRSSLGGSTRAHGSPALRASLSAPDDDKARDSVGSARSLRVLLSQQQPSLSLSLDEEPEDDARLLPARMDAYLPSQPAAAAAASNRSSSSNRGSMAHASVSTEPATEPAAQRECQICFDPLDALQAHECPLCGWAFCTSCMRLYIELKVLDGEVSDSKLVCPAPQCTRPLPEDIVEAFLSAALFGKYQAFVRDQRAGVRFCPRAGCCAVLDEPLFSRHRRVACASCEREACMRCGEDFHALPLCRRADKRFSRWKKRHNVRSCPACKVAIEKNGGCPHMMCQHCAHEFCWLCRRRWDAHDETLCLPLALLHSKSHKFGCWAPMRAVTKTVVAGTAIGLAVAAAGVAVVVLPPVLAVHYGKEAYRRRRRPNEAAARAAH